MCVNYTVDDTAKFKARANIRSFRIRVEEYSEDIRPGLLSASVFLYHMHCFSSWRIYYLRVFCHVSFPYQWIKRLTTNMYVISVYVCKRITAPGFVYTETSIRKCRNN